jgi:aminoglycoside phosphotransferase (APT) family kinase protein
VNTPAADIEVDAELALRLIGEQHPDLVGPLTLITSGWDNTLFRLGAELCVRLPRRQVAAQLIVNEQRWLPSIAERVSVPVPVPVRIGLPAAYFPWSWTISTWIDAEPALDWPAAERRPAAADLARFFAELHVPAPDDAPSNPVRGVPLASRTTAVYERLATGRVRRAREVRALWDLLAAVPHWAGPPLWLHGDPHPANVLFGTTRGGSAYLAGVVDFGDITGGDPATDLAAAWLIFDEQGREVFRDHLQDVDEDTWQRARGWAVCMGTAIEATSADNPRMAAIGTHALEQAFLS